MVRILGCTLNINKPIYIALTSIYGIGIFQSKKILTNLKIKINLKVWKLSNNDIRNIRMYIESSNLLLEGDLRKVQYRNIKRLIDINSYRGKRHLKGLPCRGQRTRSNNRTSRRLAIFKK